MSFNNKKILEIVVTIFILIEKSTETKIENTFFLCDQTDNIVELPQNCQNLSTYDKLSCEIFKNDLQICLKFEDQFNFVDSPLGQIVIYNSNSNLYLASCLTIKELFIPERVDKCTEDIPVIIKNESENRIVYLTKQGILRYHSNLREFMDENEYFETNNV
jgi:hypothetical protein